MRIAIICNDSRGGVQPYVALALGLRDAGHEIQAVAPSGLAALFEDVGVRVASLSGDVQALLRDSGGAPERGTLASIVFAARQLRTDSMDTWMRETLAGCEGADVIVGGIGGMAFGLPVAEVLGASTCPGSAAATHGTPRAVRAVRHQPRGRAGAVERRARGT